MPVGFYITGVFFVLGLVTALAVTAFKGDPDLTEFMQSWLRHGPLKAGHFLSIVGIFVVYVGTLVFGMRKGKPFVSDLLWRGMATFMK